MKRIGYVGLGIMGSAMAGNLLKAGFQVTVWNRTPSRAKPLLEAGAQWADSPAAVAAKVEAVCINVTDTPDVEAVIFGPGGIVEGNPGDTADLVVIDNSTISPAATRDFAERLSRHGIHMLDAPVTGGDFGARNATLSIMVGGDKAIFERCLPIFQAMGKTITHVGTTGLGQVCKTCNQVMGAVSLAGVCEALALAMKEGLDPRKMIDATSQGVGGSWPLVHLAPKILDGDMRPGFMISLVNKDMSIAKREGETLGLPMPAFNVAAEMYRAAGALGHSEDGIQAVCRAYEKLTAVHYHTR